MGPWEQLHARLEGVHCRMTISAPAPAVVRVAIEGRDVGELGDAPFVALRPALALGAFDLFIDARQTSGASVDVSAEWSQWLKQHRDQLRSIHMLTGSKFVQLTADFVRRFAELGERMRIYTAPAGFEEALMAAVAATR